MSVTFEIPELVTDRLRLCSPSLDHYEALCAFYASDRSRYVGGPMTAERTWRTLATEAGHWALMGFGRWAVEERWSGRFVGVVGLWHPEGFPERELGWDLMNGFEGKGYATEAGRAARDHAYGTLGWQTVISLVRPGNTGSARVAERLGARHDGDFVHEIYGEMQIWRHPGPEGS